MLLNFYLKKVLIPQKTLKLEKIIYLIYFKYLRRQGWTISLAKNSSSLNLSSRNVGLHYLLAYSHNNSYNDKSNINEFWFHLYKQLYFTHLFKISTELKNINSHKIIPHSTLMYMMYSMKAVRWKRYYVSHGNEIIEVLFLCLWLKNLKLFMDWMRKHFEKTNLKKHKKLFLLLNFLLGKLIWNYNIFLQLKGLRVVLRGKFGKAGSVRKTRKYIRRGKCSYTTKNIALINQTNVIRTLTGVYSIKMEVFF